ncbi:MAG: hypothetical protein JOZ08_07295 [Verrucomicrobia bacterium]|nr:hypothetical protein [Verrucomicrobiota bacterium]MBV8274408.1 hypothetical protein [Verrucomicrobiota bacterium]
MPLLGSLLLVVLAAVRVPSGMRRMPRWYSLLLPLALWLVAVNLSMPLPKSYPDSPAPGLVSQGLQKLDQRGLAGIQCVIVVEGSSLTMNGLDGNRVQQVLTEQGIPSLVIQLSFAGANHAERYEYLKEFVEALPPNQVEALRRVKLILCREVELGYDKNPLSNFLRNGSTGRSLRYLAPSQLPMIFSWLALKYRPITWIREHTLLTNLGGCALFNLFHVGYLTRMQDISPPSKTAPFIPNLTQSPNFAPKGSLETVPDPGLDKRLTSTFAENLAWQRKRDSDFRDVFRGLPVSECFFAFPSWSKQNADYNVWKRRQPGKERFFDGDGTPLMAKLSPLSLWYDELHLQEPGAEIYSAEFAKYLAERIRSKDL